MAEENENKRSFLEKLGDAGGGILNVAGRVGEGVVDGLAESRPLVGRPLQYGLSAAGFNTEGYQDRQDQRSARKEALLAARKRNEVLDANLEQVDAVRLERGVAQNAQNLTRDLSRNPQFQGATPEELNGVMKSKDVVAELQKQYYVDHLMRVANGDTEAQGFLGRSLKKQGWDFRMPAKKGDPAYLILGKDSDGNEIKLPATRETIDRISQTITGRAANEINAQSRLLSAKSLGHPGRRAINRYVRALLPYNGRSAADGERIVQGMVNQASDSEKTIFACRQGLIDYRDPNMPTDAKMAGLAECEPYLQAIGIRAEYDPKNPDIENMRFIDMRDPEHFQSMTIHEFEEFLRQNDTLGMNLESRVQQIGDRYRQENRIKLANLNRAQIRETAAALKPAKTAKGADKSDRSDMSDTKDAIQQQHHRDFVEAYGNQYRKLPDAKREKLLHARQEYEEDKAVILKKYKVSRVDQLPDEALLMLNDSWRIMMDKAGLSAETYYSPVNSMILERQNASISRNISSETDPRDDEYIQSLADGSQGFWKAFAAARSVAKSNNREREGNATIARNKQVVENRGITPAEHHAKRKKTPPAQMYVNGQPVYIPKQDNPRRKHGI